MSIETDKYNSYNVTYVFDNVSIVTTVFATDKDVAVLTAYENVYDSLNFSDLSSFLLGAEDVLVDLLDEDVL
jgi:hypothetical protein